MAVSSGIFSTFLCVETSPLRSSLSPPSSLRLAPTPANMRMARKMTSATASSEPTATKKREPRGIMKPRPVTPEMQEVVGVSEIPRTQALKRIWAYIKENNLQTFNVGKHDRPSALTTNATGLVPISNSSWLTTRSKFVSQDPLNMRDIICDEKLKKIFGGRDRVGFLEVAKLIGPHFL